MTQNVLTTAVTGPGLLQSTLLPNAHTYPSSVSTCGSSLGTLLFYALELLCRICLDLWNGLKSSSFLRSFEHGEQKEITWS